MSKEIQRILKEWKAEAKASKIIQFSLRNGELTIYTSQPGYFIGKGGWLKNKYTEILKKEIRKIDNVRVVEVDWYTA